MVPGTHHMYVEGSKWGKSAVGNPGDPSIAIRGFSSPFELVLWIWVIFMDRAGFALAHGTDPSSRTRRGTSDTEDKRFIPSDGSCLHWWQALYGTSIDLPPLGFLPAAAGHVLLCARSPSGQRGAVNQLQISELVWGKIFPLGRETPC